MLRRLSERSNKIKKGFYMPRRYIVLCFTFSFFFFETVCGSSMISAAPIIMNLYERDINLNKTDICFNKTSIVHHELYVDYMNVTYDWNRSTVHNIVAFFWTGYAISGVIGGMIVDSYGCKRLIFISLLIGSISMIVSPPAIHHTDGNLVVLNAIRFIQGLSVGVQLPASFALYGQWIPESEQTLLCTLAQSGCIIGWTCCRSLTPFLITISHIWGTPFFVYGLIGFIILGFWANFGADNPANCLSIKKSERLLLEFELKNRVDRGQKTIPFIKILLSLQVWVYVITHFCLFTIWTFGNEAVQFYLVDVYHSSESLNYRMRILFFLIQFIVIIAAAYLCNWLMLKQGVYKITIRKIMTNLGGLGPPIFFLAAACTFCSETLTHICFSIGVSLQSLVFAGVRLTPLDLSPNYAGFIKGLANGFCGLFTATAVNFVETFIPERVMSEYRFGFFVLMIVCATGNFIYIVFATCGIQSWNKQSIRNRYGRRYN